MKMVRLAVDFGGTRVKFGITHDGVVLAQNDFEVIDRLSFAAHTEPLREGFEKLLAELELSLNDCDGLGLAVPCLVSADCRRVTRTFQKFEDLVGFDIQAWSHETYGLACDIENDARAALIGEWRYGAGMGMDNLFMLTLGTGCGTAVVLDGKPIHGFSGMAGNLGGHSITHRGGEKCWCGSRGCLEAQVASWALEDLARKEPRFSGSALSQADKIDYRSVFTLAELGDALAVQLRDKALDTWAAALINGLHAFDPQRIIVGGGIMASADAILPALQQILDQQAIQVAEPVQIVAAVLGDGAALVGV